jgi:hypothetical protein
MTEEKVEPRVEQNASVPSLQEQLTTKMPAHIIRARASGDATRCSNAAVARATKDSLLKFRKDSELGYLNFRFDKCRSHFPTDDDICSSNSRLVTVDSAKNVEHIVHCGFAECYLADNLRIHEHSYENGDELPNSQTTPLVTMNYPVSCDHFLLSVLSFWANKNVDQLFFLFY